MLFHIVCRIAFQAFQNNLLSVREFDAFDCSSHARNRRGRHAQIRRAETDEDDGIGRGGSHLAADDRRDKSPARSVERAIDALQHRRMKRAKPIRDRLIRAIHCQQVLHQVICAETEEINLARYLVGGHHSRRHFDHRTEPDTPGLLPFTFQPRPLFVDETTRAAHFRYVRNHRQHDVQAPVRRRPENGTRLCAKDFFLLEAEANRAQAQCRVALSFRRYTSELFSTEIKEPDGRAVFARQSCDLYVSVALLFLGKHRALVRQQKLGTEKPYPACAEPTYIFILYRQLDVGAQSYLFSVQRSHRPTPFFARK